MNTEQAVLEMLARVDASVREGDLEKTLEYVADDVVHMPPDQPSLVGKPALRRWQLEFFGAFSADMVHHPDETTECGEVVIHRGRVTGTLKPKGTGDSITLNNKYLFVLRKYQDGTLKLWRAMFNSNATTAQR